MEGAARVESVLISLLDIFGIFDMALDIEVGIGSTFNRGCWRVRRTDWLFIGLLFLWRSWACWECCVQMFFVVLFGCLVNLR